MLDLILVTQCAMLDLILVGQCNALGLIMVTECNTPDLDLVLAKQCNMLDIILVGQCNKPRIYDFFQEANASHIISGVVLSSLAAQKRHDQHHVVTITLFIKFIGST